MYSSYILYTYGLYGQGSIPCRNSIQACSCAYQASYASGLGLKRLGREADSLYGVPKPRMA